MSADVVGVARACCGPAMVRAEAAGRPAPVFFGAGAGNARGPVVNSAQSPAMRPEAAVHEAAHAAMAVMLGGRVLHASIRGQPVAVIQDGDLLSSFRAAIDVAGPVGQAWETRHIHRSTDAEWLVYVANVRGRCNGFCDACRAVENAMCATDWGEDREVIEWLRAIEGIAIEAVRSPRVWRAIISIADRLRAAGEISGDEIAALVVACVPAAEVEKWKMEFANVG